MIRQEKEEYEPIGLAKTAINLGKMSESELLVLRHQVDSLLPVTRLADMDLERELTLQFRAAQELQAKVLDASDVPANQKAQVMNSVAATLQSLVKMQAEYYTPERLKKIESSLIELLNEWPEDLTSQFLAQYARLLDQDT